MSYLALRHLHITAVVISIALFTLRGAWMLADSSRLQDRWVRVVPHVVDTVLLASAIALTLVLGQYPFAQSWLTAKLAGLLVYIVLGSIALKRGRRKATRVAAFAGALLTVTYIVGVAVHHHPASWWWTPGG